MPIITNDKFMLYSYNLKASSVRMVPVDENMVKYVYFKKYNNGAIVYDLLDFYISKHLNNTSDKHKKTSISKINTLLDDFYLKFEKYDKKTISSFISDETEIQKIIKTKRYTIRQFLEFKATRKYSYGRHLIINRIIEHKIRSSFKSRNITYEYINAIEREILSYGKISNMMMTILTMPDYNKVDSYNDIIRNNIKFHKIEYYSSYQCHHMIFVSQENLHNLILYTLVASDDVLSNNMVDYFEIVDKIEKDIKDYGMCKFYEIAKEKQRHNNHIGCSIQSSIKE